MKKLDEKDIINIIYSRLFKTKSIFNNRDDISILPLKMNSRNNVFNMNNIIAFTNDMLVESTDVPSGMKPWQISRKSIVSSVSDMAAKGIRSPYYCLISLGVPNNWSKQKITNLIDGFEKSSKEFNIIFLGGDTNESKELIIDCILIGFSNNICKIPQRNNASPGDVVVTSGKFGYTAAGLKILLNKIKSNSNHFRKKAISKVLTPSPNQKFGMILSDLFSSSIDSSDGLGASLYTIAKQSKIDVLIDSLPVSNDLCSFASENNIDLLELIFNGGEEYEIVATIPQNLLDTARSRAKKNNIDFLEIGKIISGEGNVFVRETSILGNQKVTSNKYPDYFLLNYMGYSHFSH